MGESRCMRCFGSGYHPTGSLKSIRRRPPNADPEPTGLVAVPSRRRASRDFFTSRSPEGRST